MLGVICTTSDGNSRAFFELDLHEREVMPTHYMVQHSLFADDEANLNAMRNWEFQASGDDGRTWVTLSKHVNDKSLNGKGVAHAWKLGSDYVFEDDEEDKDDDDDKKDDDDDDDDKKDDDADDDAGVNKNKNKSSISISDAKPKASSFGGIVIKQAPRERPELARYYSRFRLVLTGPNSSGKDLLTLSGFEVYGFVRTPKYLALNWNEAEKSASVDLLPFERTEEVAQRLEREAEADSSLNVEHYPFPYRVAPTTQLSKMVVARTTGAHSQQWRVVKAAQCFSRGVHYWEVRVDKDPKKGLAGWRIVVGVVPSTFTVLKDSTDVHVGAQGSWGYTAEDGGKIYHSSKAKDYGESYTEGDVIGIELNLDEGTLEFFKNDVSQGIAFRNVKGYSGYQPAVSMTGKDTQVTLLSERKKPVPKPPRNMPWFEEVVLIQDTVHAFVDKSLLVPKSFATEVYMESAMLGIGSSEKISRSSASKADDVKERERKDNNGDDDDDSKDGGGGNGGGSGGGAKLSEAERRREQRRAAAIGPELEDFYDIHDQFSTYADMQLVSLVDRVCEKSGKEADKLDAASFAPSKDQLMHFKLIEGMTTRDLQIRLLTLQILNRKLMLVLPKIDFSVGQNVSVLADSVRAIRGLIFWSVKSKVWTTALTKTMASSGSQQKIEVDRFKANRVRDKGRCDTRGKRTVFGQLFRALNKFTPSMYRVAKDARAWQTVFTGEGGQDVGGLYREAIYVMCEELQSSVLPLFILSPNGREGIGQNRDKWVPRPSATRPLHLSMFEFLGQMMGLAMRSKELLSLDLPSIVWKSLANDVITQADVLAIDKLSFKVLENMKALEAQGVTPEEFDASFSDTRFVISDSDQNEYELVPNGRSIPLTWKNRHEFGRALIEYRKNEFAKQCAAMRRGLATVVPYTLLSMFTWEELQREVCGEPVMDVELLKKHTKYQGCSASDQFIQFFWAMLSQEFSHIEQQLFLKFVWGRSRLPASTSDWSTPFTIKKLNKPNNPDNYLPIGHTCFFSMDLPAYSSLAIMKKKVLFSITHCSSIDADYAAGSIAVAQESDSEGDDDDEDQFVQ
eukprot:TRINITY_DN66843_c2_g7_i1.p1 TRINITY_DN66843_c2_g7~~TRINITY_DN66843_c2_g7_i1.p1  ORF type:complete len:1251 (+),score=842.18 TRINITY_DN66843_c2_g7_i1:532-3753(+)